MVYDINFKHIGAAPDLFDTIAYRAPNSLIYYIKNNENHLINYSEYRNAGLPYTSNVIESAIGTIINSRQKENKRMSWTRDGVHNILQNRTSIASKTWERDWDDAFESQFMYGSKIVVLLDSSEFITSSS